MYIHTDTYISSAYIVHVFFWKLPFSEYCIWRVIHVRRVASCHSFLLLCSIYPKGNQSWMFIGRTDVEAETPILWPPDAKNWLIWKDPDAGKDWRQEKKGTTENEIVIWHQRLDGHEFEWTPGVGDGQGGLVCCSPWGHKESNTTEWPNWTKYSFLCVCVCVHARMCMCV